MIKFVNRLQFIEGNEHAATIDYRVQLSSAPTIVLSIELTEGVRFRVEAVTFCLEREIYITIIRYRNKVKYCPVSL
jgi:hypothetical protein